MSTLTDEEIERCYRLRAFLDTRNFDLVTQEDLDFLHEHWSLEWRLHQIKIDADGKLVTT